MNGTHAYGHISMLDRAVAGESFHVYFRELSSRLISILFSTGIHRIHPVGHHDEGWFRVLERLTENWLKRGKENSPAPYTAKQVPQR